MTDFNYIVADKRVDFLPKHNKRVVINGDSFVLPPNVYVGYRSYLKQDWTRDACDRFAFIPPKPYASRYGLVGSIYAITPTQDAEDAYWACAESRVSCKDFNFEDTVLSCGVNVRKESRSGINSDVPHGVAFIDEGNTRVAVSLPRMAIAALTHVHIFTVPAGVDVAVNTDAKNELIQLCLTVRAERMALLRAVNKIHLSQYLKNLVKSDPRIIRSHIPPMSVKHRANVLKEFSVCPS